MIKTESPIKWEGRQYFEARRLGFSEDGGFVVSLFTTEPAEHRGGYSTTVPISPASYRAKHKTKAAVEDKGNELIIYCDWGNAHRLGASREVIESLLTEAEAHDIPVRATAIRSSGRGE
jgi:protein subunit release factor B